MRGGQVKPRKLSDEVAHHLEQMIRDGDFAEADRLPSERDLMRHFGVGRPSVREALLHLSKMGLVEVRSGERARVTRPTPQFVIDALAGPARHMLAAPDGVQRLPERPHLLRGRACPQRGAERYAERTSRASRRRWKRTASRSAI